jgi:hypothetical protein
MGFADQAKICVMLWTGKDRTDTILSLFLITVAFLLLILLLNDEWEGFLPMS